MAQEFGKMFSDYDLIKKKAKERKAKFGQDLDIWKKDWEKEPDLKVDPKEKERLGRISLTAAIVGAKRGAAAYKDVGKASVAPLKGTLWATEKAGRMAHKSGVPLGKEFEYLGKKGQEVINNLFTAPDKFYKPTKEEKKNMKEGGVPAAAVSGLVELSMRAPLFIVARVGGQAIAKAAVGKLVGMYGKSAVVNSLPHLTKILGPEKALGVIRNTLGLAGGWGSLGAAEGYGAKGIKGALEPGGMVEKAGTGAAMGVGFGVAPPFIKKAWEGLRDYAKEQNISGPIVRRVMEKLAAGGTDVEKMKSTPDEKKLITAIMNKAKELKQQYGTPISKSIKSWMGMGVRVTAKPTAEIGQVALGAPTTKEPFIKTGALQKYDVAQKTTPTLATPDEVIAWTKSAPPLTKIKKITEGGVRKTVPGGERLVNIAPKVINPKIIPDIQKSAVPISLKKVLALKEVHPEKKLSFERALQRSIIARNDIYNAMDGSAQPTYIKQDLSKQLWGKGLKGVIDYIKKHGTLASVTKPEVSLSMSLMNCDPSQTCISEGGTATVGSITKSELQQIWMNADPKGFAEQAANEFLTGKLSKVTVSKKYAGEPQPILRIADRGEANEASIKVQLELNKQGVPLHIFTKRPELYRGDISESGRNIVNVSVDATNFAEIKDRIYTGQQAAVNWTGEKDNFMIEHFLKKGNLGMILPWEGSSTAKDAAQALKALKGKYPQLTARICPINANLIASEATTGAQRAKHLKYTLKGGRSCVNCIHGGIGCAHNRGHDPLGGDPKLADLDTHPEIKGKMKKAQETYNLLTGSQPGFTTGQVLTLPIKAVGLGLTKLADMSMYLWNQIETYGELKRLHPGAWKGMMRYYHERVSSANRAISDVKDELKGELGKIDFKKTVNYTFAWEDKRVEAQHPSLQKDKVYKALSKLNTEIEKAGLRMGLFKQPVQERLAEEAQFRLDDLVENNAGAEEIADARKQVELFENMRHVSHSVVAQRALEDKLARLNAVEKTRFLEKWLTVTSEYMKRGDQMTLKHFHEAGLLDDNDVNFLRLTTNKVLDFYHKAATHTVLQGAEKQGFIDKWDKHTQNAGWYKAWELGLKIPELQNKAIHPVLAKALREMKDAGSHHGNPLTKILAASKISQFIKSGILWFYDGMQHYVRGTNLLNPIAELRALGDAVHQSMKNTPLVREFEAMGLYQTPSEVTKTDEKQMVNIFMKMMDARYPKWKKGLMWLTETDLSGDMHKGAGSQSMAAVMAPIKSITHIAWTGDRAIRTWSAMTLMKMGYPKEEAVAIAANAHGAYSEISHRFTDKARYLLFTHSFKYLMPRELARVARESCDALIAALQGKGHKFSAPEWKRRIHQVINAAVIPLFFEGYLRGRGFKTDKTGWKWTKEVTIPKLDNTGKPMVDPITKEPLMVTREIVVTINNIYNLPLKMYHRLTWYNPILKAPPGLSNAWNILKWELHPMWRTANDIAQNRQSFGGMPVYDAPTPMGRAWQIGKYGIAQSFKFYGAIMSGLDRNVLTLKNKKENERVMTEGLNVIERFIFSPISPIGLGYAYPRKSKRDQGRMWNGILNSKYQEEKGKLVYRYEHDEVYQKKLAELKEWKKVCRAWVYKTYGYSPNALQDVSDVKTMESELTPQDMETINILRGKK